MSACLSSFETKTDNVFSILSVQEQVKDSCVLSDMKCKFADSKYHISITLLPPEEMELTLVTLSWTVTNKLSCFLEQGMLVPELPAGEGQAPVESEASEEAMERLAHLEQLVVQLKELIRDKDTQLIQKDTELANKDAQFKVNNLRVCLFDSKSHYIQHLLWLSTNFYSFFCFICTE